MAESIGWFSNEAYLILALRNCPELAKNDLDDRLCPLTEDFFIFAPEP